VRHVRGHSGTLAQARIPSLRRCPDLRCGVLRLACCIDEALDTGGHEERLAKNEVLFRAVNESIEQQALRFGGIDDEYEFLCECSSTECVERVTLTLRQYEQVRAEGTRFVLAPGHADPQVELVVRNTADHDIVEKDGLAGVIAEQADPRSAEAPSDFERGA